MAEVVVKVEHEHVSKDSVPSGHPSIEGVSPLLQSLLEPVYVPRRKVPAYPVIDREFNSSLPAIIHNIASTQFDLLHLMRVHQHEQSEPVSGYEPYHVMIEGSGGSGKSIFSSRLVSVVNSMTGLFAYLRTGAEKYGDDVARAYRESTLSNSLFSLLVLDDIYIQKDDPPEANFLMHIVNSSLTPMIVTDKSLAGTVAKPLIIISTTNNPYPNSKIDVGALARRVHKRVVMKDGHMYEPRQFNLKRIHIATLLKEVLCEVYGRMLSALQSQAKIEDTVVRLRLMPYDRRLKVAKESAALAKSYHTVIESEPVEKKKSKSQKIAEGLVFTLGTLVG